MPNAQKMRRYDGYLEGNGYCISWAFGHLFSLADIEHYAPSPDGSGRWSMQNLPCFPKKFDFELRRDKKHAIDPGVQKQFDLLCRLCNREDVEAIINAGDADREGEIIIRLCISHALRSEKPCLRLWLPDQTPQTVVQALEQTESDAHYDNLANEGFARTYIDWLYGVNLTRYATLKTGSLLRVGRVIVPIVRAVYDRDMAIRNFVPGKYFVIASREQTNGETVELVSKLRFEPEQFAKAEEKCALYNAADAVVTAVKRKKETIQPGKLYSLSKLQNVLGKKYKMSMAESLEIVQKLYEMGYLTYPRTNSEYLATAEKDKVRKILSQIAKMGYPVAFKESSKIFDDSKIESHSAITPTYKIPGKESLGERERQVYATVFRRFVAVFCAENCTAERTEMTVRVGEYEDFVLKGLVILEKGWMRYDDATQKDKHLPHLEKGDKVNHLFKPTERETSAPKHYTIETLNNYLKNPFREEKSASDEDAAAAADSIGANDAEEYRSMFDGVELGTEATRTGIIDNARNSGYIQLKKDVYTILPGGEFLIESLSRLEISMDKYKTCNMGRALKRVYRGEMTVEESVNLAKEEIAAVFENATPDRAEEGIGLFGQVIGTCPLCAGQVRRNKFGYGCAEYRKGCPLQIPLYLCEKTISVAQAKKLLSDGKTDLIRGFRSKKTGKTFDAVLLLRNGRAEFSFPERSQPQRQYEPLPDDVPYPIPEEAPPEYK